MKQLTLFPSRLALLTVFLALFNSGHAQDAPGTAPEQQASTKSLEIRRSGQPPSFLVTPVSASTPDTTLPVTKDSGASAPASATKGDHPEVEPAPDSNTQNATTAEPASEPTADPVASSDPTSQQASKPAPIAIEETIGDIESAAAFQDPTLLLFLCGYHLELVSSAPISAADLAAKRAAKGSPGPVEPEAADRSPREKAEASTANPPREAQDPRSEPEARGLVTIGMPPTVKVDDIETAVGPPSITIHDHHGKRHDFEGRLTESVELRILTDILTSIPDPSAPLSSGAIRDIFNLVGPVTGHPLVNENAGRLARALDQAILVKSEDGAGGAVIYINGEPSQAFFDDLNVSNLDIPITSYVGREGFENAPEGYPNLTEYPATAIIWNNQEITATFHFTEQDLIDFETGGKVKELLVTFLKMFPEGTGRGKEQELQK